MNAALHSTIPTKEQIESISSRHRDMWAAVALGYSTNDIAKMFDISPKTVSNHRDTLYKRLNIHDVATLTRAAIVCGVISIPNEHSDSFSLNPVDKVIEILNDLSC